MALIKPFCAYRPRKDIVSAVAALPYDVYNREEAKEVVAKNPLSFLRIDRAETQFDDSISTYDPCVYNKAKELLNDMISKGQYVLENKKAFYVYELTMDGRTQTGIVGCASIDDYMNNVIKKHENTREEKEIDRINHVDICDAQTGPIFLAYRAQKQIDDLIEVVKKQDPEYSFYSEDGIKHQVYVITDEDKINILSDAFSKMNEIYIADGHHRAASAVKVGIKRRNEKNEIGLESDFFLSVLFPDNQLKILPYNRVVSDLNGHTEEEFFELVSEKFNIIKCDDKVSPSEKFTYGMFVNEQWYMLTAKNDIRVDDPVEGLDVSILQNNLLNPILGIKDPRTDKRIDFVGGIRGLAELEKRTREDMKIAFSMYPTSIKELFDVADAGMLMPPKSTWFEPKLRSGIFIHKL
ncbi:MAG: DUF1015 family protein [Lachnospiraceae bacterium]|nr:DUF1015 family protein [Lachnospiraceae bacterium]